jgi:hypothetical protein
MTIKFFEKIKHIIITPGGDVFLKLQNGAVLEKRDSLYADTQTGELHIPLYSELNDELVGFIKQ